jgi:hypothetical protein
MVVSGSATSLGGKGPGTSSKDDLESGSILGMKTVHQGNRNGQYHKKKRRKYSFFTLNLLLVRSVGRCFLNDQHNWFKTLLIVTHTIVLVREFR